MKKGSPALTILSYAGIYIVWSSTYYAIKLSVATIPPFYVVGLRFFIGGCGLLAAMLLTGRSLRLSRREFFNTVFIGALLLAGGNGLVTMAQRHVDSYMAAIIVSATPIAVALWDRFILKHHIRFVTGAGIAAGLAGVAVLMAGKTLDSPEFSTWALVLAAAISFWGLGTSLSKKLQQPADPLLTSGLQQAVVGGVVLCLMAGIDGGFYMRLPTVSAVSWAACAYLAVMGGAVLAGYSYLLKHEPNERVVTYAFVNPVLASFIGIGIGHEEAGSFLVPAGILVFLGLFMVFFGARIAARFRMGIHP